MAERRQPARRRAQQRTPMSGAVGASDATSGGGAGSGIPDADTAARTAGRAARGNVERDRQKLFPEAKTKRSRS